MLSKKPSWTKLPDSTFSGTEYKFLKKSEKPLKNDVPIIPSSAGVSSLEGRTFISEVIFSLTCSNPS